MPSSQLVTVLISISTALVAFMLPFGYTFIKNLDEDLSKEVDEILKLLKKEAKKKSKECKIVEDIKNLKDKVTSVRRRISNFSIAVRIGLGTLLFSCLVSIFFGVWILLNGASNYSAKVIIIMLCVEIVALIYYFVILWIYKPLKEINELRDKKARTYLKIQKIDHDFISVFSNQKKRRNKMKMQWSITKLIVAGSLGAVHIIFILPGVGIVAMTGIPGMGAVTNLFVDGIFFAFCCLLIRKFGAATLMGFVATLFAIPLPYFGTPGFLPKIIIGIAIGLIADCIYFLLKRNTKVAAIVIGGCVALLGAFMLLGIGLLFSIPGIDQLANLFLRPITITAVFIYGAFAGYVGYIIFNKLRNTALVRRIQG